MTHDSLTTARDRADAAMVALEGVLSAPRPTSASQVRVGVDLGTACTVVTVLDGEGSPLAATYTSGTFVRDGVVVDYLGAVDAVRRLRAEAEDALQLGLTAAHGAIPPGVPISEARAVEHVLEAAGLECTGLIDEPSAANLVLGLDDGAVIDVGGGSTGVAVVRDGRIAHTEDEPTGGTHVTLVIAGALGITFDEADRLKKQPSEQARLLPLIRPVMERVAAITLGAVRGHDVHRAVLVGGPTAFPGFAQVVAAYTGLEVTVPHRPAFVTPLGIALAAPLSRTVHLADPALRS